jgi:thioredoxin-related protein
MKKALLLTAIFLFSIPIVFSQINFQNLSLEKAKEKAKKENKLIFIDVYADWCRPCKMLDAQVFIDKKLGDFFNEEFICIKYDGDTEEGGAFMVKHQLTAFPTMLFMSHDEEIIRKVVGFVEAEKLINEGKYALDPSLSPSGTALKNYEKTPNKDNYRLVIEALLEENLPLSEHCKDFYTKYPDLDFSVFADLIVFYFAEDDVYSENYKKFLEKSGEIESDVVIEKINNTLSVYLLSAIESKKFEIVNDVVDVIYPHIKDLETTDYTREELIKTLQELYDERVE